MRTTTILLLLAATLAAQDEFIPLRFEDSGRVLMELPGDGLELIHSVALTTGLGSNPVGLDRGRLGAQRVLAFRRIGNRVLLEQRNLRYRSSSARETERRAVAESFATSVIWGGVVSQTEGDRIFVDMRDFFMSDAAGIARTLERSGQGSWKLDVNRSAFHRPRCKAFPDNTEVEILQTFSGTKPGAHVRETAPTAEAVSLRVRHSFIRLPDDGYRVRANHPRAGYFGVSFSDYSAAIDEPMDRRWISRHRLELDADGKVVEPLVYHVDPGIPEPIRSAVVEGAGWWAEAFEKAGFPGGYRVEVLPDDADPLDMRYNMIQWVHRSTRGWSYGGSVSDPRTGEILKGHVRLGSLRVRQDRLLFEGLEPRFASHGGCAACAGPDGAAIGALLDEPETVKVALARIRQLAAHEVGHTLGLAHNFAASTYGRASVMDYPAPLVKLDAAGRIDLSEAYDVGVGAWDVWAIRYGYATTTPQTEEDFIRRHLADATRRGLLYITDADARPAGAVHPLANLWDNGEDPLAELAHVMRVRAAALSRFSEKSVPERRPMSSLEDALVPLYLHHRYQVDATSKILGGARFTYATRGEPDARMKWESPERQRAALEALLATLAPDVLRLDDAIVDAILPAPPGGGNTKERFGGRTGSAFDPMAAAEVAADMVVTRILNPQRAARMQQLHERNARYPGFDEVLHRVTDHTWRRSPRPRGTAGALARVVERVVLRHMIALARDGNTPDDIRALVEARLVTTVPSGVGASRVDRAHFDAALREIADVLAGKTRMGTKPGEIPPGSPIGNR